ncbi:hypothetical protein AAZV13_11G205900 [Glycine max]
MMSLRRKEMLRMMMWLWRKILRRRSRMFLMSGNSLIFGCVSPRRLPRRRNLLPSALRISHCPPGYNCKQRWRQNLLLRQVKSLGTTYLMILHSLFCQNCLKRFGCVCKSWALLFENPHFMNIFGNNFISDHHSYYDDTSLLLRLTVPIQCKFNSPLFSLSGERFQNRVKLDWLNPFQ